MKPVPRTSASDATIISSIELRGECKSCNSGAQHFRLPDDVDEGLRRLVELWPILFADDRQLLMQDAERLASQGKASP